MNYGGSTGFGRAYRERLNGQWGVVDVADCAAAAQAVIDQEQAHPERVAIEGAAPAALRPWQPSVSQTASVLERAATEWPI